MHDILGIASNHNLFGNTYRADDASVWLALESLGFEHSASFGCPAQSWIYKRADGRRVHVETYYRGSSYKPLQSELPRAFAYCEHRVFPIDD